MQCRRRHPKYVTMMMENDLHFLYNYSDYDFVLYRQPEYFCFVTALRSGLKLGVEIHVDVYKLGLSRKMR